jgi:hypothetical protein
MLLFDFPLDLIESGVCPNREQWANMKNTAEATRDAFMKALNEWYLSATVCLDRKDPCRDNIVKQYNLIREYYETTYIPTYELFWKSLIDINGEFNVEVCNKYRKMMIEWRCMLRKLFRLVDGDGDIIPCTLTIDSLPTTVTTVKFDPTTNINTIEFKYDVDLVTFSNIKLPIVSYYWWAKLNGTLIWSSSDPRGVTYLQTIGLGSTTIGLTIVDSNDCEATTAFVTKSLYE